MSVCVGFGWISSTNTPKQYRLVTTLAGRTVRPSLKIDPDEKNLTWLITNQQNKNLTRFFFQTKKKEPDPAKKKTEKKVDSSVHGASS